jgi:hypothetical protein
MCLHCLVTLAAGKMQHSHSLALDLSISIATHHGRCGRSLHERVTGESCSITHPEDMDPYAGKTASNMQFQIIRISLKLSMLSCEN